MKRWAGQCALGIVVAANLISLLAAQSAVAQSPAATGDAAWRQQLAEWRAQREKDLAAPDGWLTLVGLEWLKSGVNTVGSGADNQIHLPAPAPIHLGLLTVSGKPPMSQTIQLLAPGGGFPADMKIDGAPAREGPLSVDDQKPSTITWNGLTMVVLHRGDRYALRIKDANSPTRTGFHGLNWYELDPRYRIVAKWIPFTPPLIEKIPTVIGTTLDMPSPGAAEFALGGKTLRLEPVTEEGEESTLSFILRDLTSQTTTYQSARFLHTGLPSNGLDKPGTLTLDFNQLENPPCAYTPYATCPLPPEQNRLAVALQAGEKRYSH
jgi:hypothetical protein